MSCFGFSLTLFVQPMIDVYGGKLIMENLPVLLNSHNVNSCSASNSPYIYNKMTFNNIGLTIGCLILCFVLFPCKLLLFSNWGSGPGERSILIELPFSAHSKPNLAPKHTSHLWFASANWLFWNGATKIAKKSIKLVKFVTLCWIIKTITGEMYSWLLFIIFLHHFIHF